MLEGRGEPLDQLQLSLDGRFHWPLGNLSAGWEVRRALSRTDPMACRPRPGGFLETPRDLPLPSPPARGLLGGGLTLTGRTAQSPTPPTSLVPLHSSSSVTRTGVVPPPAQHRCRSCLSPWTSAFTWIPPEMGSSLTCKVIHPLL